jgi:hypothetical protein
MQLIKKIIREELEKVLANLNETDLYAGSRGVTAVKDSKDNIIGDYEKGRAFAGDNLQVDIDYLYRYQLQEYLPKSEAEETWSFEFDTVIGTTLIVDIKKMINGNKSFWTLSFGQLYKGETHPTLITQTRPVEGYNAFIKTINSSVAPKIDPSKF